MSTQKKAAILKCPLLLDPGDKLDRLMKYSLRLVQ
jgi:hypothetical protein